MTPALLRESAVFSETQLLIRLKHQELRMRSMVNLIAHVWVGNLTEYVWFGLYLLDKHSFCWIH
jgi:putative methionine-R-sulfoxide reductase with GAF domain